MARAQCCDRRIASYFEVKHIFIRGFNMLNPSKWPLEAPGKDERLASSTATILLSGICLCGHEPFSDFGAAHKYLVLLPCSQPSGREGPLPSQSRQERSCRSCTQPNGRADCSRLGFPRQLRKPSKLPIAQFDKANYQLLHNSTSSRQRFELFHLGAGAIRIFTRGSTAALTAQLDPQHSTHRDSNTS